MALDLEGLVGSRATPHRRPSSRCASTGAGWRTPRDAPQTTPRAAKGGGASYDPLAPDSGTLQLQIFQLQRQVAGVMASSDPGRGGTPADVVSAAIEDRCRQVEARQQRLEETLLGVTARLASLEAAVVGSSTAGCAAVSGNASTHEDVHHSYKDSLGTLCVELREDLMLESVVLRESVAGLSKRLGVVEGTMVAARQAAEWCTQEVFHGGATNVSTRPLQMGAPTTEATGGVAAKVAAESTVDPSVKPTVGESTFWEPVVEDIKCADHLSVQLSTAGFADLSSQPRAAQGPAPPLHPASPGLRRPLGGFSPVVAVRSAGNVD